MASSTQAAPPAGAPDVPYRDDPDDVESTPLLAGDDPAGSSPGAIAAGVDVEQATVPNSAPAEDGSTREGPRRRINFSKFYKATLILGVIILVDLIAFSVMGILHDHDYVPGFTFPVTFGDTFAKALLFGLINTAWEASNIHRYRKRRAPFPPVVGTVAHGILGFYSFGIATQAADGLNHYTCWSHYPSNPGDNDKCQIFSWVFWSVLLFHVVVMYILALLQEILFVACLTAAYRGQLYSRGSSQHGFIIPGGQLSIEFTIRFLRQDAPPPVPIRDGSSPVVEPVPATTATPAPVSGTLISTD